jgi:tellurite resistance protein
VTERRRAPAAGRTPRRSPAIPALDADTAILALLVTAMASSGHIAPEENARADNIIWAMRRFRNQPGERIGRLVERVKTLIERHGIADMADAAARSLPPAIRAPVFAVAADVVLVDGRFERQERRYLERLGRALRLTPARTRTIVSTMRLKNGI